MQTIQTFTRDSDVIAQANADSLVLFQMRDGSYFSLNECGARIWEYCDGTKTAREIAELMAGEYDAPVESIEGDVSDLLRELAGRGLLAAR
jgi:hypothetical protein